MYLQELIPNVNLEDYSTEFKARLLSGLDRDKEDNELKWLKEIVAFANTQGGTLYVGVNDKTHELEPLTHVEADRTVQLLYSKIEERVEPSIAPIVEEIVAGNDTPARYILKIEIRKSATTPVYVHVNGVPACYVRQFGRAKIATPEQIAELVIKGTRASYDTMWTKETFDPASFKRLFELYQDANPGKKLTKKVLESIGFLDDRGYLARGALLFRDDCQDEITLAKATLFPSFDKGGNVVKASESYQGCLIDVIGKVIAFIENHSVTGYQKLSDTRVDLSSFPSRALFEGVINAFAHRNYFVFGTEIEFDLFPDRLEITSPGSLLGGKNLHHELDIGALRPKRRNELICRVFELVHFMEAKGTGLDKISEDYALADARHKPFVSCDDDSFTLTLPDLSYHDGVIGVENPYPSIHLLMPIASQNDEKILSCCYAKERSLAEIASYLGVSPSTHLRKEVLEVLVSKGYLYQRQRGKAFVYWTNREKIRDSLVIKKF